MKLPRISFGMIVLNGEPFVLYNLRALYPFAHQIIVVEGAAPAAASIAASDGHSNDGTLDTLRHFKKYEDVEDKLIMVTAEDEGYPDGFWPGEKDEQSQAYTSRATGDYLWQVDVDEFYLAKDMEMILQLLQTRPSIDGVSFKTLTFFGDAKYIVDGHLLRAGAGIYRRLFKWRKGYQYVSHRPPTVVDNQGTDLSLRNWIDGRHLASKGIFLLHYSLIFPKQVAEKAAYYDKLKPYDYQPLEWFERSYLRLQWPFRYHNVYLYRSWLERYHGETPEVIQQMMADVHERRLSILARHTSDIEALLRSPRYVVQRLFWRAINLVVISSFLDQRMLRRLRNGFRGPAKLSEEN
jgi:hypothetical protein